MWENEARAQDNDCSIGHGKWPNIAHHPIAIAQRVRGWLARAYVLVSSSSLSVVRGFAGGGQWDSSVSQVSADGECEI